MFQKASYLGVIFKVLETFFFQSLYIWEKCKCQLSPQLNKDRMAQGNVTRPRPQLLRISMLYSLCSEEEANGNQNIKQNIFVYKFARFATIR